MKFRETFRKQEMEGKPAIAAEARIFTIDVRVLQVVQTTRWIVSLSQASLTEDIRLLTGDRGIRKSRGFPTVW